jgi:hypothetical protein
MFKDHKKTTIYIVSAVTNFQFFVVSLIVSFTKHESDYLFHAVAIQVLKQNGVDTKWRYGTNHNHEKKESTIPGGDSNQALQNTRVSHYHAAPNRCGLGPSYAGSQILQYNVLN